MKSNEYIKYETKKEFINAMKGYRGWSERNFKDKIKLFLDDYGIKEKYILDGDKDYSKLKLNEEYKGLFHIIAKGYNKDPFLKSKAITFKENSWKDIEDYYKEVLKGIDEELNDEQRYDIINSYPYIAMIREMTGIRKINEKLQELKIAIGMLNMSARADIFEEMYACIDTLILIAYNQAIRSKEIDKEDLLQAISATKEDIILRLILPENNNKSIEDIINDLDLIRLEKYKEVINEREECDYIGDYLVSKLKKQMSYYENHESFKTQSEKEKAHEKQKEILENINIYVDQTNKAIKISKNMNDDEVTKSHNDKKIGLLKELEEHISKIKNSYNEIETMEAKCRKIINCIDNNSYEKLSSDDLPLESRDYYENYLEFVDKIKQIKNGCK
ncbi:hypothetical protein NFZ15_014835 [Clostridioides difficile]|nr:hypothetical protein [Clostridioides difficile]HBG0818217.1 hypothetical protein [Clostridioides difficile]